MTLSLAAAARDAWRHWTAGRGVVVAIAGPFLFLPVFALLLLVEDPQRLAQLPQQERVAAALAWFGEQLPWLAVRAGLELFATLAILSLFLARDHRDVRGLLRRSLAAWPLFAAAVMTSWGLVASGLLLFVVPGLYIYGRVALTGPVAAAEPNVGFTGAVVRSVALTHGNGWRVLALLSLPLLLGLMAVEVIGGIDRAMTAGGDPNPLARATLDGLAALAVTASHVARILLQMALYRRLAAPRHGV